MKGALGFFAFVCGVLLASLGGLPASGGDGSPRVLVFSKTTGFRHPSIADGIAMITNLASEAGFSVDTTEDGAAFSAVNLAQYDAVVWLSTTGDVLDAGQQSAFETYIETGGGWVGIHAAADCEYQWPWYGELLGNGAWFDSHPAIQEARLEVEDFAHPGSGSFPASGLFSEEWYNFRANPRPAVEVVLTLDENSYEPGPGAMGADHPIAWYHRLGPGRAFYTALGHRPETYADPRFRQQVKGAILWASGHLLFTDGFERGDTSTWPGSGP